MVSFEWLCFTSWVTMVFFLGWGPLDLSVPKISLSLVNMQENALTIFEENWESYFLVVMGLPALAMVLVGNKNFSKKMKKIYSAFNVLINGLGIYASWGPIQSYQPPDPSFYWFVTIAYTIFMIFYIFSFFFGKGAKKTGKFKVTIFPVVLIGFSLSLMIFAYYNWFHVDKAMKFFWIDIPQEEYLKDEVGIIWIQAWKSNWALFFAIAALSVAVTVPSLKFKHQRVFCIMFIISTLLGTAIAVKTLPIVNKHSSSNFIWFFLYWAFWLVCFFYSWIKLKEKKEN